MSHTHTNPLHAGVGKVSKSYQEVDHVKEYCLANSTAPHPVQQALMQETLKLSNVSRYLYYPTLLCNETFNIVSFVFNILTFIFNIVTFNFSFYHSLQLCFLTF